MVSGAIPSEKGCPPFQLPPMQGALKSMGVVLRDAMVEVRGDERCVSVEFTAELTLPPDASVDGIAFSQAVFDASGQPVYGKSGAINDHDPDDRSCLCNIWCQTGESIKANPAGARVVSAVTGYRYDAQVLGTFVAPAKGAPGSRIGPVAAGSLDLLSGILAWGPSDDEDEPGEVLHLRCAFLVTASVALNQMMLGGRWRNRDGEEFYRTLEDSGSVLPGNVVYCHHQFRPHEIPIGNLTLELKTAAVEAFGSAQLQGLELTTAESEIDLDDDNEDSDSFQTSRSDSIVVRFALTSGDGNSLHSMQELTEEEKQDIRRCLALNVYWDPDMMSDEHDAQITSMEILYDGITRFDGEDFGYSLSGGDEFLGGYPAPIIRFKLDRELETDQFICAIRETSFRVLTSSMDHEPYYAEDHNGYTQVLDDDEVEEWIGRLKAGGVYSGKQYEFPEGMEKGGVYFDAVEFALSEESGDSFVRNGPESEPNDEELDEELEDEFDDESDDENVGISLNIAAEAQTGKCLWFYAWKRLEGERAAGWVAGTDFKRNIAFRGEFIARFDGEKLVELFVHGGDKDEESWETHDYVDTISGKTLRYQDEPSDAEWAQDEASDAISDWMVGGIWEEGQDGYENRIEHDKREEMKPVGKGLVFEQGDQSRFSALKLAVREAILSRITQSPPSTISGTATIRTLPPAVPAPSSARVDALLEAAEKLIWSKEFFFAPAIPERKLLNAVGSMAPGLAKEDVAMLVDTTVFGGAKEGLLLSRDTLFVKDIAASPKHCAIHTIRTVELKERALDSIVLVNPEALVSLGGVEKKSIRQFVELLRGYLAQPGI